MHWDGREKVSGEDGQPWGLAWPLDLLCDLIDQTGSERCGLPRWRVYIQMAENRLQDAEGLIPYWSPSQF